jgi:hypothetical protein
MFVLDKVYPVVFGLAVVQILDAIGMPIIQLKLPCKYFALNL